MKRINPESFIGLKSNMLKVIGYTNLNEKGRVKLKCLCDCGNETYIYPYQFTSGEIKSCGCAKKNIWGGKRELPWMYKHGLAHDRLYKKFTRMKQRCYNPNSEQYERYGARGITICKEWLENPEEFVKWAIENGGENETLTIDRINGNGPYSPENCRFVTPKEQSRNISTNRIIEFNGESHCLSEWAEILGFRYGVLTNRLYRGWSIERTLTEPFHKEQSHKKHCETKNNS